MPDAAELFVSKSTGLLLHEYLPKLARSIETLSEVPEAIYHVVEHFSMHTGQVIWLAKARRGVDLGLWRRPTN